MSTAKIFKNGRSQAVCIPKDFAFEGVTELTVRKVAQGLVLEPVPKFWMNLDDGREESADGTWRKDAVMDS